MKNIIHVEENPELTLEEICQVFSVTPEFIQELVEHSIIDANLSVFTTVEIHRIRKVVHLKNDLDVNLSGAALVLELMEELQELRARMAWWERQIPL